MNDFQILSKLGDGAYSTVYKVKRLIDGNIYALKKVKLLNLSEKEKINALNEVRILASVKSNFLISYKEAFFDENESCLGIVMEYADKGDLYQKITEFKKAAMFFEESDIWRIFIQMIKGLKALHDLKILHRDLKSANIFLFTDGSAKLGDLNVSKVARRGLGYTQTGTPYYASPEVWKDQPYDNKSDIWSLGCVLYEMITLRPPFRAENMEGLYNKVIKGQINKIPDRFSLDLMEIVKLLIQVSPDNRPACEQILKNPLIQKRIEYFKAYSNEDMSEDQALLQTIKIPKNLLFLSDKLPQPNYEKVNKKKFSSFTKTNQTELPDIASIRGGLGSKNKMRKQDKESIETVVEISKNSNENLIEGNGNSENNGLVLTGLKKKYPGVLDEESQGKVGDKENEKPQLKVKNENLNQAKKNMSNLDNSIEDGILKQNELPELKSLQAKRLDGIEIKKQKEVKVIKIMPSLNEEHINSIYKIYAPYLKQSPVKYPKYNIEKKKGNNLKNIEKYYEYYNVYKPKKKIIDHSNKMIPHRKLSPIKRNILNIV